MTPPKNTPTSRRTGRRGKQTAHDPFNDVVAAYPDEYLTCRDTGHSWRPTTATREKDGTIHRTLTCNTCGTHRIQTLDSAGYIITNSYTYKTGYQIPGAGRLDSKHRAALRLASITRISLFADT